ncbi:hypothetical protein C8F01DRAFT_752542 [Mycena amicta]|nr:hypothetical protein C8F01DRAFT_752542 [Mycena amicta]
MLSRMSIPRSASLLITLCGGLIHSFLALQLASSWPTLRSLEAESESEYDNAWLPGKLRTLLSLLASSPHSSPSFPRCPPEQRPARPLLQSIAAPVDLTREGEHSDLEARTKVKATVPAAKSKPIVNPVAKPAARPVRSPLPSRSRLHRWPSFVGGETHRQTYR